MGDKFVPTSWAPSKALLDKQLKQFERRVLIRDFFAQQGIRDETFPPPDTRLRVANPSWHPLDAMIGDEPYVPTPAVYDFLDEFAAELHSRYTAVKPRKL